LLLPSSNKNLDFFTGIKYISFSEYQMEDITMEFSLKGTNKSKVSQITEGAKTVLLRDELLTDVIDRIINKARDLLTSTNRKHKMKIYLSRDMEVPNWEELVLSIGIEEEAFSKIIEFWNKIERETEGIINEIRDERSEEISHIEKINNNFAIEVDRLENV